MVTCRFSGFTQEIALGSAVNFDFSSFRTPQELGPHLIGKLDCNE